MMFSTTDPLNRTVILKASTWENKIINTTGSNDSKEHGNSHKEMEGLLPRVKDAVEHPMIILKDTYVSGCNEDGEEIICVSPNREEYFSIYVNSTENCLNGLKVIVEFDDEHQKGEVVTTHRMNGKLSKVKAKGGVVYDASRQKDL